MDSCLVSSRRNFHYDYSNSKIDILNEQKEKKKWRRKGMKRLCIRDCKIGGLIFVCGLDYEILFNPINKKLIICNPYGFTTINKKELDINFL